MFANLFQNLKISRRKARRILILVALLVLFESLLTLMLAKDVSLFAQWQAKVGSDLQREDYLLVLMVNMGATLAFPIFYSIYLYIAQRKGFMPRIAKWTWGLFLFYSALMILLEVQFTNPFWYLRGALSLGVLFLHGTIDEAEKNAKSERRKS